MAKKSMTITSNPLQPTFDAIDQSIKMKTDGVFLKDADKVLIDVSMKQIDRVRKFLIELESELNKLDIHFLIEKGKFVITKGVHRFNLRVRERRRQVRTIRKKRSYESEPNYDLSYAWAGIIAVNHSSYFWREWFETRRRKLENSASDIAKRINNEFYQKEKWLLQELEEEKENERRRELRRIHQARMELEKDRYDFIQDYFKRLKGIEKINETREKIKVMFSDTNDIHYRKIDKWLQSEARRIRSQISPKAVKSILISSQLFDGIKL